MVVIGVTRGDGCSADGDGCTLTGAGAVMVAVTVMLYIP